MTTRVVPCRSKTLPQPSGEGSKAGELRVQRGDGCARYVVVRGRLPVLRLDQPFLGSHHRTGAAAPVRDQLPAPPGLDDYGPHVVVIGELEEGFGC